MKIRKRTVALVLALTATLSSLQCRAQNYPAFGPEKEVTIVGLNHDAMEPFLSPDGTTLFFNNLNDGVTTRLYYATRVNDSTFTYVGELNGPNETVSPYLNAVADMDSLGNFYWTSARNYPAELDNMHHGTYSAGNVTNIGRVRGDFNMNTPGWLCMDHGISIDGQTLYFNNARFDGTNCQGPCETMIGVAQKVNDSTFMTLPNSAALVQSINDPNFKSYATCISSDDLELYYTRFPVGPVVSSTVFEICVVVRSSPTDNFSAPHVLFGETIDSLVEAPTLTQDNQIMYYHKKTPTSHKIVMRHRVGTVGIPFIARQEELLTIYPNPAKGEVFITFAGKTDGKYALHLMDASGKEMRIDKTSNADGSVSITTQNLQEGTYYILLSSEGQILATEALIVH